MSVASDGTEGDDASSCPAISADGRFVAFSSSATNLVAGDTNDEHDIFVHDRETGTTERVSVASDGTQSDPVDFTHCPAISADGRFVAFGWNAANLVAGDTNDATDVFVHDRQTGTTERVSVASDGTQGDGLSVAAAISADGRFVAFQSEATNLVAGDANGFRDVFVHDRTTGVTERVSIDNGGLEGDGDSTRPSISGDGSRVAFASNATNLVAGDGNGLRDIFVHDRAAGTTVRVNVASDGAEATGSSNGPAISSDGGFVSFESAAENLVVGDANMRDDIFVHDLDTGQTERVSIATNGAQTDTGSGSARISGDGRFVVFISTASTLVPGDGNGANDVFVRDRGAGSTTRVSVADDGTEGNAGSGGAFGVVDISDDGLAAAFPSNATTLVPGDENGASDVFVSGVAAGAGERFEYAAKVVCGTQTPTPPLRLAPGFYATSVNIHNPTRGGTELFKKLALTLPPGDQIPGDVLPVAIDELGYDQALQADCADLGQRLFPGGAPTLFEGFLVIQTSQRLDVTAVYTAAALGADGEPGAHSSLHIEQIPERDLGVDLRLTKQSLVFDIDLTDSAGFSWILYGITVENVGDEPATGVLVQDVAELVTENAVGGLMLFEAGAVLPPGAAITNLSPPAATFPPAFPDPAVVTLDLELGDIPAGDSRTALFWGFAFVFPPQPVPASGVLTNTATAASQEPEISPSNNVGTTEDVLWP